MASITIENPASEGDPVPVGDLYRSLAPGDSVTITRPMNEVGRMVSLLALVAAGTLTMIITPSADEVASGILTPAQSVQIEDLAPVESTDIFGPLAVARLVIPAGGANVRLIAAGSLPFKMRILQVQPVAMTGGQAQSAVRLRTATANGGTLIAELAGDGVGSAQSPDLVLTPGENVGLFAYLTDTASHGIVNLYLRPEV